MRTTLTLDEDVSAELQRLARRTGKPFKELVNATLRAGLQAGRAPGSRRYQLTPSSLGGVVPGIDLDPALRLADSLESAAVVRKFESQK